MPIMFNTLLREAGFPLCDVRLVRHQDTRAERVLTTYDLWLSNRQEFERYQETQDSYYRKTLTAPYWAVFVGTPDGGTMFVGVYGVRYRGLLEHDRPMPNGRRGILEEKGSCHAFDLTLKTEPTALGDLIGNLFIDWGEGRGKGGKGERAFVQYADRHDKPITELRLKAVGRRSAGAGRTRALTSRLPIR